MSEQERPDDLLSSVEQILQKAKEETEKEYVVDVPSDLKKFRSKNNPGSKGNSTRMIV